MRKILLMAALAATSLLSAPAMAANLLVNGSFEARVVTFADTCAVTNEHFCVRDPSFLSTPGWTQFGDGVDLINNNYSDAGGNPYPNVLNYASDGVNFLDMNQLGSLGGVFQVVGATAGQAFNLSLDTSAWATNGIGGTIGYELYDPGSNAILASGIYTDNVGGTWINRTLSANATSNQIGVRIQALFSTQAAPGLDNVILTATPLTGGVPEPASWALMIAGFGLTGAALRKANGRRHTKVRLTYT